jgi:hypothetical protein
MPRRRRNQRRWKALFFSFVAACIVAFVFDEGSGHRIHVNPLAIGGDSSEAAIEQVSQPVVDAQNQAFPAGFKPQWTEAVLDGRIKLQLLKQPYPLGQTERGLGSEYFAYAASIFEQMAKQMDSVAIAKQLRVLSTQAEALGNTLKEASRLGYDGPPNPGMAHLKVREDLLSLLQGINRGNLITVSYNQDGKIIESRRSAPDSAMGDSLKAFLENSRAIAQSDVAKRYPESVRLLQAQTQWLEQIAKNVTLRWENVLYCPDECTGHSTRIRLYLQQTLPNHETPNWLANAT